MAENSKINLPRDRPFDYQLAMQRLADFEAPRNKLASLCASGEVIRVKKGLYLPGGPAAERVDPLVLASLVYGPSYVSREFALARYGLIPERVDEITCMTTKRARAFDTPVGRFSYRPIHPRVFSFGVGLEETDGGSYFLASPEKALCDRLATVRGLRAQRDVARVLEKDLRIDLARLEEFDLAAVAEISRRYRRPSVRAFSAWLAKKVRQEATAV